jgi:hypothetical protein
MRRPPKAAEAEFTAGTSTEDGNEPEPYHRTPQMGPVDIAQSAGTARCGGVASTATCTPRCVAAAGHPRRQARTWLPAE